MKIRPGDSRIAQIIRKSDISSIPSKSFVLLGIPDDRGVAISKGRIGAKKGPDAIRKEFYKMTLGIQGELEHLKIFDGGNLKPEKTQERTYQKISKGVADLLQKNCFPILLGGGHDLSFGSLSGFLKVHPDGGIVNIDAHLDCRPSEIKGKYSSGTAFRQLLEKTSLKGKNFLEFGFQKHCNAKAHLEYLKNKGVKLAEFPGNFERVFKPFAASHKAIAISFDMDCVQSTDAPGVSALAPIGYSAQEALHFVQAVASQRHLKLFEIMEVNPLQDPDGRTAKLAACLIWELLVLRQKKKTD